MSRDDFQSTIADFDGYVVSTDAEVWSVGRRAKSGPGPPTGVAKRLFDLLDANESTWMFAKHDSVEADEKAQFEPFTALARIDR